MNLSNETYHYAGTERSTQSVGTWLTTRFQHMLARLEQRRARARELRELYRCTDRELWDIGLSRSDFLAIENGTYRRD